MDITDEKIEDIALKTVKKYDKSGGFTGRKLTDIPTDALQVTNKKYVDNRISSVLTVISGLSPGSTVKASGTGTAANPGNISITGLDLNTDIAYELLVLIVSNSNSDHTININFDTSANYGWTSIYDTTRTTADSDSGIRVMNMIGGTGYQQHLVKIKISREPTIQAVVGTVLVNYQGSSSNVGSSGHGSDFHGMGVYNSTTTVSTITIYNSTANGDWAYTYRLVKVNA